MGRGHTRDHHSIHLACGPLLPPEIALPKQPPIPCTPLVPFPVSRFTRSRVSVHEESERTPVTPPHSHRPVRTFWNRSGYFSLWLSSRMTSCCRACWLTSRASGRCRMAAYVS